MSDIHYVNYITYYQNYITHIIQAVLNFEHYLNLTAI
jgi:hypothetical protein